MAGTLTTNVVKDVYTKLSFHKIGDGETLGQLYTDDGSNDVSILDLDNIQTTGVTSTTTKFEFKTGSSISSNATLFDLKNNTNSRFKVFGDGVIELQTQESVPTIGNYNGGSLYSDGQYLYLASDDDP